jgi:hypothetical protein
MSFLEVFAVLLESLTVLGYVVDCLEELFILIFKLIVFGDEKVIATSLCEIERSVGKLAKR